MIAYYCIPVSNLRIKKTFLVLGDKGKQFEIYVDGSKVTELGDDLSAVIYYFALYYVLNLKYPAKCCLTLEYIQR